MAGVDVFELQAQIGGLSLGLVSGYHRVGKRLGGGLVDLILRGVPEDPRFGLAPGISGSVDAMHAPAQGSEDGEDGCRDQPMSGFHDAAFRHSACCRRRSVHTPPQILLPGVEQSYPPANFHAGMALHAPM